MIRLSDVKVQLQYRWRVRQRLMVLHFARLHGATAAGRRFGVSSGPSGAGGRGGVKVGWPRSCLGIRHDGDGG